MTIKRVIVIGLDGLEPALVEQLWRAGELPHLATLRAQGGFARVGTTAPAQTPVAWSTFATGLNPGGHGVFDFIRRDPKTYLPDLGLNRYEQKNAFLPPRVVNSRRGTPVWEHLKSAGIPATVIRCPCSYPPDRVQGRLLCGMGVPDLRGGLGTGTFFTTRPNTPAGEAEMVVQLHPTDERTISTHLIGPRNPKDRSDSRAEITLRVDRDQSRVVIESAGNPQSLEVPLGKWSDWLRVKFKLGMLQTVRGGVRFFLKSIAPDIELYATPANFDPEAPLFPISNPESFASELADGIGLYYTAGMIEDHAALSNSRIDEPAFLAQAAELWDEREAMLLHELERFESGLLYCLFDTPDRVQHMLWRHREPDHPANRGRAVDREFANAVLDQYRRADEAVRVALEYADEETLVVALSDHGFNSFRRGVNLNTWLYENGLLKLRPGVKPGEEAGDLLRGVDWSQTKAYALGLGGIYLNLKGREGQGIVDSSDVGTIKAAIARGLNALGDEPFSSRPIRSVTPREEAYRGPCATDAPDLVVNFAAGYRASWGTSLGGVPAGVVEDNTKTWGGDHIIDPALVPGILLMNKPFSGASPRLLDLAPSILKALGVPTPAELEGQSLL